MKILYIIDSLGVGGAEKLLINTILSLPIEINCTVVYLNGPSDLVDEFDGRCELICLDHKGMRSIFSAVTKLRNIIFKNKIDVVHAHLFWSTLIARLACPSHIKLIFSVHCIFSKDVFQKNKLLLFIEKLTYCKEHLPVFVSNAAKEDYDKYIGLKGDSRVLYNFVEEDFFLKSREYSHSEVRDALRLVSVGNLKASKNYQYLVDVFKDIKGCAITLDIYGEGAYREDLEKALKINQISNIRLKGTKSNISDLLANYDLFVMPSESEGFCIAVAEAMAAGVPCLLSDIDTFKEVSDSKALFFDLNDHRSLLFYLNNIDQMKYQLLENAKQARVRAEEFRIQKYTENLLHIYSSINPQLSLSERKSFPLSQMQKKAC